MSFVVPKSIQNLFNPNLNNIKIENHCFNSKSMTYDDIWINIKIIAYADSLIHHVVESDTVLTYTNLRVGGEFIPKNYENRIGESLNKGYISLQSEGHPVEFRNIKIREIF